MKPIETKYKGYRFRSRLEARWAVFFSALGLAWEYEPEGFDLGEGLYYLPDFKVHYPELPAPIWIEVKPAGIPISADDMRKIEKFGTQLVVLIGPPGVEFYGDQNFSEHDGRGRFVWVNRGQICYADMINFMAMNERGNDHRLLNAIKLARSARFEHGQMPAC